MHRFFLYFFGLLSKYLAPSGAKYREKGLGRYKNWRGVIDKPILELLTFGSNPDFSDFLVRVCDFDYFSAIFWAPARPDIANLFQVGH